MKRFLAQWSDWRAASLSSNWDESIYLDKEVEEPISSLVEKLCSKAVSFR
jgi:hypothetical protein